MRLVSLSPRLLGSILACLALLGQLTAVIVPLRGEARPLETIAGVAVGICHAGPGSDEQKRAPAPAGKDCVLCPICLSATLTAPAVSEAPVLPLPRLTFVIATIALPPPTGPPGRPPRTVFPRGPPPSI